MFRASDEVHERKADGDRAGELSQEVEVAKAALDQVTRQVERDRARDNRPGVAKELEEAVRAKPAAGFFFHLMDCQLEKLRLHALEREGVFVWSIS